MRAHLMAVIIMVAVFISMFFTHITAFENDVVIQEQVEVKQEITGSKRRGVRI